MIWLNDMPDDKGIYGKYSPRHIFTGREIYYTKHCREVFRDYVEAIKDAAVKKLHETSDTPAYCIRPFR